MSAQVRWCSCWYVSCDLACDDGGGGAEVEDGEASATHQHDAASSPKGSRRPRSGFTSRDSWKSTRCVRYFILIITFNAVRKSSLIKLQDVPADRRIYAFYSPSSILPPLNETASKQSLPHCNATPTCLDVSSKLSCHAVPHVNRTRACCHSPMHRVSVCTHGLS